MADTEREAFEAWARDPIRASKLPLERWPTNGAYKDTRTYTAFYGWKAGRAALASRPAEVDDEGLPPLPDPHWAKTESFTAEQFRQGQRDAVAADRARVEKPVAYAVVSKKSGIHKLCITRPSAERKAAVWREAWPNNACTVRPLVFGDSATTNKEK